MLLALSGYYTAACRSAEEGLEVFQAAPSWFGAVIVSWPAPDLAGADLAGELKAISPDTPIFACLPISEGGPPRFTPRPIRGWLNKPFTLPEIAAQIGPVVAGRSARPSAGG